MLPFSSIVLVFLFCTFLYLSIVYLWSRRRFYYYASKTDGPMSFPIIGSTYALLGGTQNILENGLRLVDRYKPIFPFWLGHKLFFVITKPEHIEVVLNNALEKIHSYKFLVPIFGYGLITLPVNQWKKHRKVIALTFNQQILNSFVETFNDYSTIIVEKLEGLDKCYFNVFPLLTQCTLDIVCDTTMGTKVNAMKEGSQYILWTSRASELGILRMFNIFLHPESIWKLTSLHKEMQSISEKIQMYLKKIVETKREEKTTNNIKKKIFLDHLLDLTDNWSDDEIIEETRTVLVAGSDATALTIGYVLMMLGMHPEIQEKVFDEISVVLDGRTTITSEDLHQLCYLERVIKETLRLFPAAAAIARLLTKDIVLDDHILPKGSSVCVPIIYLHRDSELWSDPLKFDPDRFLVEETSKRHPYSYLPFSGGSRNCIGFRYAMMAMKTVLSTVLRRYKVLGTPYKNIEEIELKFDVATKCVKGQKIRIEKR